MVYTKLFPVSHSYHSLIISSNFDTDVYADNSLKCAIVELGACKAFMYLKSPDSDLFWIGHKILEEVEVYIVGWDDKDWLINYNDKIYKLPMIHFIELRQIKAASQN